MKKRLLAICVLTVWVCTMFAGCDNASEQVGVERNRYIPYTQVTNLDSGIRWPEGQVLPTFATPAETVDMISIAYYNDEEQITVTALQGLINKTKPRLLLLEGSSDATTT